MLRVLPGLLFFSSNIFQVSAGSFTQGCCSGCCFIHPTFSKFRRAVSPKGAAWVVVFSSNIFHVSVGSFTQGCCSGCCFFHPTFSKFWWAVSLKGAAQVAVFFIQHFPSFGRQFHSRVLPRLLFCLSQVRFDCLIVL